jgi:hypothetical protein
MGCGCCSKLGEIYFRNTAEFQPLASSDTDSLNNGSQSVKPVRVVEPIDTTKKHEEHIELVFRSKRMNVFARGYDVSKSTFKLRVVPKTKRQAHIIRSSIAQNFIFASLNEDEISCIVDAMELMKVAPDTSVITQGKYILASVIFFIKGCF